MSTTQTLSFLGSLGGITVPPVVPIGFCILLETGDKLLLEEGVSDCFLLEESP